MNFNIPIPDDYAVSDVFRLGKKSEQIRPVLIKFTGTRWLKLLFENIKSFKNSNLIISKDYSKEERENRKILREKVQILKETKLDVSLKNNKIFIDGKPIQVKEIEVILNDIKLEKQKESEKQQSNESTPPVLLSRRGRGRPTGSHRKTNLKTNRRLLDYYSTPILSSEIQNGKSDKKE